MAPPAAAALPPADDPALPAVVQLLPIDEGPPVRAGAPTCGGVAEAAEGVADVVVAAAAEGAEEDPCCCGMEDVETALAGA